MKIKDQYKVAIEGYQKHWDHYNHWMNMYAIFNGALFVALYTIQKAPQDNIILYLLILIHIMGCVAGWCWFFSSKGFYSWLISWISVVKNIEKNLSPPQYIYGAFYFHEKLSKCKRNKYYDDYFSEITPFSTQKLTQCFSCAVAITWSIITIYCYCKIILDKIHTDIKVCILLLCILLLILGYILCIYFKWGLESNLLDSHKVVFPDPINSPSKFLSTIMENLKKFDYIIYLISSVSLTFLLIKFY